ncbi:MAG: thiamine pyrophosphate-dependent enzyme [Desulfobacterales bacterium]|jgi:sulfopyruvate decarboxylase subunit beta
MIRKDLLTLIHSLLEDELVICNLGSPSQELYSVQDRPENFYMLGSMGMVSSMALGLSLFTQATVIAIDGDGSVLMNPGSLITIAHRNPPNLKWIVIDNGSYGSTGNQPTYTRELTSLAKMAKAAGIKDSIVLTEEDDIPSLLKEKIRSKGLCFIVIKIAPGNLSPGPIPYDPLFIRNRFMKVVWENTRKGSESIGQSKKS